MAIATLTPVDTAGKLPTLYAPSTVIVTLPVLGYNGMPFASRLTV